MRRGALRRDSEHPCNDATKPLYEEEYQASLLQCAASLDFPFSKALSAMDEDEMAMARKKEGGLMAADDADEI